MSSGRATVVGAGLAGSLMAIELGKMGWQVEVLERRSDPRKTGGGEGKSINLAISTRGIHALAEAGVADRVLERAVPMKGRMMHGLNGKLAFQPYGTKSDQVINSVSRSELNLALITAADSLENVHLSFEQDITEIDVDKPSVSLSSGTDPKERTVESDMLLGADGAFSMVRQALAKRERFDYSQNYLAHGYKELTIPPAEGGGFRLEPNALHIWPRGGFMMIALPNYDGSFTCTLFWPFKGPNSFEEISTTNQVDAFFRRHFQDAVEHLPDLTEQFAKNPVGTLVTVRSGPWFFEEKVVLVGDACHAVVPFYGQGANAAFEDCTVLKECMIRSQDDRAAAFSDYFQRRKLHVDTLADLAIGNFLEMRDHVASPVFRLKKLLGRVVHRIVPWWYLPIYSMITFSRIPYADAVRRSRNQHRILAALAGVA
ncbi:MAG: FAD-dependent monooxygenase, partial [Gemmatimonadota bacterium]|nr:FAD-dependent monooxygenase [Gemmatimonadota bacterium]